jgi:hypothetical protein
MKPYLDPINSGVESLDGIYEPIIPCDPAKNLTVTYTDDCKAQLQWDAQGETGVTYKVYRDNSLIKSNVQETTYTDSYFVKTEGHTWEVAALCSTGVESDRISVTKEACLNIYTVLVSANPEEGGTVSVTGGANHNENTNVTVKATPNENYSFVNWTKENVEASTEATYTFVITEDVTLIANFIEDNGINENERAKLFTIYPNPANSQLNIVRTNAGKAQVVIYNNIGLIVQSYEINEMETKINIATLSSGIYFMRLMDNQNSSTQSFVKE